MNKLSFEKFNEQIERFKSKLKKYSKILIACLSVAAFIGLLVWLFLRQPHPSKRSVPSFETNKPQEQQSQKPKESTSTPPAKSASPSAQTSTSKKCCTNAKSGQHVDRPPYALCIEYEFGKTMNNVNRIIDSLGGTGLTLQGANGKHEFNGFISSITGQASLSKYAIYLYSENTLNHEFEPPYLYKTTPCTDELKDKITKVLDPIRETL